MENKNEEDKQACFGVFIFIVIIIISAFSWLSHTTGSANAKYEMQIEAIKQGYAQWDVDERGHTSFQWKKIEVEKRGK
jgi:hypothetical protein